MLPLSFSRPRFKRLLKDFFEYVNIDPVMTGTTVNKQVKMYLDVWDKVNDEGRENLYFNFVNGYIVAREQKKERKK